MDKFTSLVRDYKNYIWKVAHSILRDEHLAQDCVQEVLLILSKNLDKLDLYSPRAKGFITVVTRHKAYEFYKKEKRLVYGFEDLAQELAEEIDTSSDLMAAIHSLSPTYSAVLILSAVHGYSDKEIGDILHISHAAVRKRKERARNMLEEVYFRKEGRSGF